MKACFLILTALVAVAWSEAPYPGARWSPARAFLLPVRQPYQAYQQSYHGTGARTPTPTEAAAEMVESTTEPLQEGTTEPLEEGTTVSQEDSSTDETTEKVELEDEDTETAVGESLKDGAGDAATESLPMPLYYFVVPGNSREQRVLYTPEQAQYEAAYRAQFQAYQDFQTGPHSALYAYAGPLTRILRR